MLLCHLDVSLWVFSQVMEKKNVESYQVLISLMTYMRLFNLLSLMISNIFLIFKSLAFWINLILSVILIGPLAFIFGLFSYEICLLLSKLWCRYNIFFLDVSVHLKYEIQGPDLRKTSYNYFPSSICMGNYIFCCICGSSNIYFEKELLMIPLFGWCLYLLKNISIDRSDGISSLKKL